MRRQLTSYAWPALVEYLLHTVLQLITIAMVGRLGGTEIAAVGVAQQIMMIAQVLFMGLSVATTALVARAIGARRFARAEVVAKQSLLVGLVLSVVMGFAGYIFAEPIMSLMGSKPEVIGAGGDFLRIQLAFSFLRMIMVVCAAALRGAGDMKTPMVFNGLAVVVNVVLSYGLIYGELGMPRLEITGAAWASIGAQSVASVLLLIALFSRPQYLKMPMRGGWLPQADVNRSLLDVGGPSVVENIFMNLGMLLYAVLVIRLGTEMYATQSILFSVVQLSMMPGFAFAMAATTLVGQNIGARRLDRAERSGWAATEMSVVWMSVMGAAFFIFPRQIIGLFTGDTHLVDIGEPCLRIIGLAQPFSAVAFTLAGALRGAGDTRFPMFVTAVAIWLVRLPFAALLGLALPFGLTGMWVAHASDFILRSAIYLPRYKRGAWKTIRIRGE